MLEHDQTGCLRKFGEREIQEVSQMMHIRNPAAAHGRTVWT
jgi:hypothetical protein